MVNTSSGTDAKLLHHYFNNRLWLAARHSLYSSSFQCACVYVKIAFSSSSLCPIIFFYSRSVGQNRLIAWLNFSIYHKLFTGFESLINSLIIYCSVCILSKTRNPSQKGAALVCVRDLLCLRACMHENLVVLINDEPREQKGKVHYVVGSMFP